MECGNRTCSIFFVINIWFWFWFCCISGPPPSGLPSGRLGKLCVWCCQYVPFSAGYTASRMWLRSTMCCTDKCCHYLFITSLFGICVTEGASSILFLCQKQNMRHPSTHFSSIILCCHSSRLPYTSFLRVGVSRQCSFCCKTNRAKIIFIYFTGVCAALNVAQRCHWAFSDQIFCPGHL